MYTHPHSFLHSTDFRRTRELFLHPHILFDAHSFRLHVIQPRRRQWHDHIECVLSLLNLATQNSKLRLSCVPRSDHVGLSRGVRPGRGQRICVQHDIQQCSSVVLIVRRIQSWWHQRICIHCDQPFRKRLDRQQQFIRHFVEGQFFSVAFRPVSERPCSERNQQCTTQSRFGFSHSQELSFGRNTGRITHISPDCLLRILVNCNSNSANLELSLTADRIIPGRAPISGTAVPRPLALHICVSP
ncbi:hypothetical protein B0H11DRAFT_786108 [Mycena galericulata]|nr:hypothetical protein B0H11DRAFT_786108 [Mycena galericulata]